jgi:teichuronic acid biosynthesis glycosyltransferase TuaG
LKNLISIITPSSNSSDFIEQTAMGVLSQTYQNWEWLITDDCSQDASWSIIDKLCAADSRIKAVRNDANFGAALSRNRSLDRANGEYVAFLDSDDVWRPEKLEKQVAFMQETSVSFSFTAYEIVDTDGRARGRVVDGAFDGAVSYEDMLCKKATMGCSTVMLSREAVGPDRMPNLRTGQDYAFWLTLLKKVGTARCLPVVLTSYRIHPGSISRNKFSKAKRQWQIYRDHEKLRLGKSLWCFANYAYRALAR